MLLNTQKDLLDQVYRATIDAIGRLPENFRKDSLKNLLEKTKKEIREGSVFCSSRDTQALKEILAGSDFSGFRFGGTLEIPGGIVVESSNGQLKIDYRLPHVPQPGLGGRAQGCIRSPVQVKRLGDGDGKHPGCVHLCLYPAPGTALAPPSQGRIPQDAQHGSP